MKRKLEWLLVAGVLVLVAASLWAAFAPKTAPAAAPTVTSGVVISDDVPSAILDGHYYLWLMECDRAPQTIEEARALCRVARIEVDEDTWLEYTEGDSYPRVGS